MDGQHRKTAVSRHPVVRPTGLGAALATGTTGAVRSRPPGAGKASRAWAAGAPIRTGWASSSALTAARSHRSAAPTVSSAAAYGGERQTVTVEGSGCSSVSVGSGHRGSATTDATIASGADDDGEDGLTGAGG